MKSVKYFVITTLLFFGATTVTASTTRDEEIQALLTAMTGSADKFSEQINSLNDQLGEAIQSEEIAKKIFNTMKQTVKSYLDKLGNESEFKKLLDIYIQRLDEAKERNLERFDRTNDADYKDYAEQYALLSKEAGDMLYKILDERKQSIFLLDKIIAQQDKVIEEIQLGIFEKANKRLKATLDNLKQMRTRLTELHKKTRKIGTRGRINN
jgi:vacuolar-type H+-ATPase subunit H